MPARRHAWGEAIAAPFTVVEPGTARRPIVVHIPHASTVIPSVIRAEILLDDAALDREIVRMTDWHVDALFSPLTNLGATAFVNQRSRLVFDPERFVDDAGEPAAAVGQGVIYTHTSDGLLLRSISQAERSHRIAELYDPYHAAFTELVADTLGRFDRCLILDCHSFPSVALPTESGSSQKRPDICIGTDPFHTPPSLVARLREVFVDEGLSVAIDSPFEGTLVPLAYHGRDRRVSSVMIEVRRDLYCDETTGEPSEAFAATREKIARAVELATVGPAVDFE